MGWHLLTVTEIQPAVQPNKAKVYAEIKTKMIAERAYDQLQETARTLEDLLGEGLSLKEAATHLGLDSQTFTNVDITASDLPESLKNQELMQELFTLKEGEVSALMEQANGYLVAQVQKITPVQAKNFADVQSDLKKLWRAEQQKARVPEIIEKAIAEIKSGSIPAKWGRLMVVRNASLTDPKELPAESVPTIFTQEVGYENAASTTLPNGVFISVVKKVRTPLIKANALPDQMEQLSANNAQLLYDGVVASYADKLGIRINTEAIQKAFAVYQKE